VTIIANVLLLLLQQIYAYFLNFLVLVGRGQNIFALGHKVP